MCTLSRVAVFGTGGTHVPQCCQNGGIRAFSSSISHDPRSFSHRRMHVLPCCHKEALAHHRVGARSTMAVLGTDAAEGGWRVTYLGILRSSHGPTSLSFTDARSPRVTKKGCVWSSFSGARFTTVVFGEDALAPIIASCGDGSINLSILRYSGTAQRHLHRKTAVPLKSF